MNYIKLTQGQYTKVDDEDFGWLNKYKWYASYNSGLRSYYVMRNKFIGNGKRQTVYMHRVIMNASKDKTIDHINHDTLDNRKGNLRLVTQSQNLANRRKRKDNISGYKGVSWCKDRNRWRVRITGQSPHKEVFIGYYQDKKEAARAYNEAAKKYVGEYAKLNKV